MEEGWIREAPTVVVAPEPSCGLVDTEIVESLVELCDDENPDFFRELVSEFARHAELRFAELRGAVATRDGESVYRVAHTLRGSAGNVGARHMANILGDLQRLGHEGRLERATRLIDECEDAFRRSITILAEAAR